MRTRHPQRRPRDFIALTLLATTAMIPISAFAQDASPNELDSVLVTGTRNDAKPDLTDEQIRRRNASSVADLIEQVSGLSLNSLYSRPEVSVGVQGVAGHGRVVLQLEGIPQNFHAFTADIGQTGSIFIDPMLLAGIDVTRGGGTGTSTLGGLGSAVDFRYTNVGDVLEPGKAFGGIARLSTGVTNWGNGQRPAGSVFVAGRSDRWQWMLGATHVDNDAYKVGGNFSMSQMAENFHGNNIKFYDGIRNITSEGGCRYYGITGVSDGSRDGLTTCQLSRQQLTYLKQAAKSGALEGTEKRSASTILRLGYDFGGEHDQRLELFAVNSRARYRTEQAPTISIPGAWDGGEVGDDAYWKDDLWDVRTVLKSTVASLGYSGAFSDRLNPSARIYYEEQQRNQNWTGMQGSYAFGAPLHYHAKNASFGLKLDNTAYLVAPVIGRVRLDAGIEVRRRDKTVDSLTEQEYLRDYQSSLGYVYESPKWDPDSRNDTFGAALALSTDSGGPFKASLGVGWQRVRMTVDSPTYLTGNQAKAGVDDRPTKLTELRAYYRSLGYSSSVARQMAIADLEGYSDQFKIDTSRGTTRYVYDDARHRFDLKSANLLLQYSPEGSGFSGRAQVSYNERAPTSNEMYVAGVWNFVTFTANPDLKPEKNTSLQLGADYARAGLWSSEDRLKVGLLLYRNDIRNYIGFGPIIGHDTVTYVSSEGTLRIGDGGTTGSILGDIVDNGALVFNRSDTLLISGAISGAGTLEQAGAGRTILSANNTYTGGTTISAGALQIGAGGTTGSISGDVVNNGDLIFNRSDAYTFGGVVSGSGDLFQSGLGTLVLTGANQYAGTTTVASGTLIVNGNQSAATGATSVAAAATLGGTGVIGGDVTIASGATLSPGFNGPGTLTINGDLSLSSGSLLQYQFGQADTVGGPLNDLTVVAGDLVLDGTINVTTSVGGSFDAGIYRVISYAGALTNNGLTVGTIPADSYYVQTSIANQVNLINTTGLTLNYWDGGTGLRGDGLITGGDGVWQNSTGNENWTTATGSINAPFTNGAFAIFAGSAGTVTIDRSLGAVSESGMQFATNGYVIQGDALDLVGDVATVRVGDGSSASAGMTATINSVLTGASTLRKSGTGTLVLNAANTYAGGTSVEGGVLQVSADANLGAAGGAVSINGATLRTTTTLSTARALQLGALGGTLETAAGTTLTASGVADGAGALAKTGAGTLVLSGTNTYAGGTTVTQGILQIAQNANLGATAGGLTLNGGALQTTANITSGRALAVTANSGVITNDATTLTWTGALTGAGVFTKTGGGTMVFNGDGAAFTGGAIVDAGTLAVDSVFAGTVNVLSGGRLEGNGRTGNISNAGVVAPGRSIGTLTVGNYVGAGGTLEIEAVLGDDTSSTDRLVVTGATSGNTLVSVINVGGLGAQTVEGIKIIDVAGVSNGQFTLNADYLFEGDPTVIAGAYGYRLYKNGVSTPTDGDWYLRSTLTEEEPEPPLYQPGVPIYEAYPQALLALNTLPTMQQRVGNRAWSDGVTVEEGVWGRVEGFAFRPDAVVSTASVDLSVDRWQMQFGLDKILSEQDDGSRLVGGITAHYGNGDTSVRSVYGDGSIDTEHYGMGATLTWFGTRGVYIDGQANFNWFDSDLNSKTLGRLFTGNNGTGQAYSFEIGMRTAIKGKLSLTPQFQMVYSTVDFDTFADPSDAVVSASKGDSLKTRWGVSLDYRDEEGPAERTHLYGLADLSYEWRGGAQVDVSGTPLAHRDGRLWLNVGAGGTRSWDNGRKAVFGEVQATTATRDFGSSYGFKGVLGFRVGF